MSANNQIWYNHVVTYSETDNNAVGPTNSLILRTLDNPTPTNSNTIFLAPNGNDANPGTLASPVLTLVHAASLLGGAFTTIQIIRNGYVGPISFSITSILSTIVGILQVELGETATINLSDSPIIATALNGLYINVTNTTIQSFFLIETTSTKWCNVQYTNIANTISTGINTLLLTAIFNNSIINGNNLSNNFSGNSALLQNKTGSNFHVTDSIIINSAERINGGGPVINAGAVLIFAETGKTYTIEHCVFFNNINTLIVADSNPGSSNGPILVQNCIFQNNSNNFAIGDPGMPPGTPLNITYSAGMFDTPSNQITLTGFASEVIFTTLFGINPLFINSANLDFHLFDQRRLIPGTINQYYGITSQVVYNPGLGQVPGSDTRDLGPYDITYSVITDTWDRIEWDSEYWNQYVEIDNEMINLNQFKNIQGNARRSFDAQKRSIVLKFDANTYIGTLDSYKFQDLQRREGAKRWYPLGDTGLWAEGNITMNSLGNGQWQTALPSIYVADPIFFKKRFEGFICEIQQSGSPVGYFQITDNASGALYLQDHRGNQQNFSAGAYSLITCLYDPVEINMQKQSIQFPNWQTAKNPLTIMDDVNTDTYNDFEGHEQEGLVLDETDVDI